MRPALLFAASFLWIFFAADNLHAVNFDEVIADQELEKRAREISKEIRCVVCQNESIDDSNADIARTLRIIVRERLAAGDSDSEVKEYLVARYGEFVLLRPPFRLHTALLWISPLVFFIIGAAIFARVFRKS